MMGKGNMLDGTDIKLFGNICKWSLGIWTSAQQRPHVFLCHRNLNGNYQCSWIVQHMELNICKIQYHQHSKWEWLGTPCCSKTVCLIIHCNSTSWALCSSFQNNNDNHHRLRQLQNTAKHFVPCNPAARYVTAVNNGNHQYYLWRLWQMLSVHG